MSTEPVDKVQPMAGYTKLFQTILASTIWGAAKETKIVWITMLAMADKHGCVHSSIPGLATMARLTIPETETALAELSSPDPYSRTKDFDGRRIETIDGGWFVLNHPKYRDMMTTDDRREYNRIKQQEYRARQKMSTNVSNPVDVNTPPYASVDVSASGISLSEGGAGETAFSGELPDVLDTAEFRTMLAAWLDYKGPKAYKPRGFKILVSVAAKRASTYGVGAVCEAMERAMSSTWKGWDQPGAFGTQQGGTSNGKQTSSRVGAGQRFQG